MRKPWQWFRNLSVKYKLFWVFTVSFLVLFTLGNIGIYLFWERNIRSNVESELSRSAENLQNFILLTVRSSIKNYLRSIAEKDTDIIRVFYRRVQLGQMTRDQALVELNKLLLSQKIGSTGYPFVLETNDTPGDVRLVVHPMLIGEKVGHYDFIQEALRIRSGYFEYNWRNPGEPRPRAKSMYISEFPEWKLIVAASSYREEILDIVNPDDFRRDILRVKFGESGYHYIVNGDGEIIVHPFLSGNALQIDPLTTRIFQKIVSTKNGVIYYPYHNNSSGSVEEKIVVVRFLPELDWYVCSSGFIEEFQQPLKILRMMIAFLLIISAAGVFIGSFWLGALLTKPLNTLIGYFRSTNQGPIATRFTVESSDEFGTMVDYLNKFIERLEITRKDLQEEVVTRRNAEITLAKREKRFRTILDTAAEGFWEIDTEGTTIAVNPEMCQILGRPQKYIIGKSVAAFTDESGKQIFTDQLTIRKQGRKTVYENHIINANGNLVHCLFNASPQFNDRGELTGSFAMVSDITLRKMAEQENRTTKEYLQNIIDSLFSILITVDGNQRITQWNRSAEAILRNQGQPVSGQSVYTLLPFIEVVENSLSSAIISRVPQVIRNVSDQGDPEKYYHLNIVPLTYREGSGAVILLDDVTELKRKDEQLIQIQKMELIGKLSGGLAHDFNNILGGITGAVSLLQYQQSVDPEFPQKISEMIDILDLSAKRARDIVQQLLTLARKHPLTLKEIDLREMIGNVVKICKNTFDKSVSINWQTPEDPALSFGDPTQIEQVLLNVAINGYHAMTIMRGPDDKPGGVLTLELKRITVDSRFRNFHIEAVEPAYWCISLTDNGIGIPHENLQRIFDPFFTTKEKDVGTGLGLAMVYNIARQHGGFIGVYSQVGVGTTFNLHLPLRKTQTDAGYSGEETREVILGKGRVMVVDDEILMQEIAQSILKECGYNVVVASDGNQCIGLFADAPLNFDLILLDLTMPGMSGGEVYDKLRQIDPGVRVLMTSGHRQDKRIDECLSKGVLGFIPKPFSFYELSQIVGSLIRKPDSTVSEQ